MESFQLCWRACSKENRPASSNKGRVNCILTPTALIRRGGGVAKGRSSMKLKEGHGGSTENSLFIFPLPTCCHRGAGGARRGIHFGTMGEGVVKRWSEGNGGERQKGREGRKGLYHPQAERGMVGDCRETGSQRKREAWRRDSDFTPEILILLCKVTGGGRSC